MYSRLQSIHRDVCPSILAGYLGYDFPPGYGEEFEGSPRFSWPRQATSCITILLQFPEQKLRDTFHHDVTGTKLFLFPPPSLLAFRSRKLLKTVLLV